MTQRTPVSILGATGLVGQRFAARLAHHPWFEVAHLAAGPRSVGKSYGEACRGRARPELAESELMDVEVVPCTPRAALAPIVFSALDRPVALELEPAFARAGATVFSNAAAFRMEGDVPLLVPEVNGEHLELLADQRRGREWPGAIVCNPNCTTAVLVTALAPLHRAFGLEALSITSLQAASGAGFAGVSAVELSGNVLPYIEGEEEKLARETQRILGSLVGGRVEPLEAAVSAACHRVDVLDGHTLSVSARFRGNPSPEQVRAALADFVPEATAGLPSAPRRPVVVHAAEDRPQPRLDCEFEGGMPVHVGRVRECAVLGVRFVALGHNLERGAAGGSVLNAELWARREGLAGGGSGGAGR